VKTFHHKTIYPSKRITIFWGDEALNSNKLLTVILILSLIVNVASTSIIIALNQRNQTLSKMLEEAYTQLSQANTMIAQLSTQLNYTTQQLEYYKRQLEYYTTIAYGSSTSGAVSGSSEVNIVAVREVQEDIFTTYYEGVVMKAKVEITPGNGRILVNTQPNIGIDLQSSIRTAATVAEKYTGISLRGADIIVSVIADKSIQVVDGPSAGAAITIAIISAVKGLKVNSTVYVTGTINPDGSVGSVGGVLEKAVAAARNGCKLFLVPMGEANIPILQPTEKTVGNVKIITYQYTIINLESYLKSNGFNVKVIEVGSISEVAKYMLGG